MNLQFNGEKTKREKTKHNRFQRPFKHSRAGESGGTKIWAVSEKQNEKFKQRLSEKVV